MPSSSGGVTLFTPQYPIVIRKAELFDPTVTPATGHIIPTPDCLVVDQNWNIWIVVSVDPITHASTLRPARMFVDNTSARDSLVSVVSYGNDVFRVYFDPRTTPVDVRPDARLVIYGLDVVAYQLVRNPGPNQVVISRHYDASGNYTGVLAPMAKVTGPPPTTPHVGANYPQPCHTQHTLVDGEAIALQAFNSEGAQVAEVHAFAKESIIINEAIYPEPIITGMEIISTQKRGNNEVFIFQNQTVASLALQVRLTYSNGYTRTVDIDQLQCFLYGADNFVPSYPGLRQKLLAKYFLDANEVMSMPLAAIEREFVAAETYLVVVSNALQADVKISTIPVWNNTTGEYHLAFFLYSTTRDHVINVTSRVTLSPNTPFNGAYFGQPQVLTLQVDMAQVEPTIYTVTTIYSQTCVLTLNPLASPTRYLIRDATNAPIVYGNATSSVPRPVIHYDAALHQYFVPSSLFTSAALFLQAFYKNASPPYDTANETQAPTPTHFQLRDPSSGVLLTAAPIPVSAYTLAVSIVGAGPPGRYVGPGLNMLVEFLMVVGANRLILYGVPVDTALGTYV